MTNPAFWIAFFAVYMTAMTVSMCKPDQLRHRELPVWLWVALAGREARARLRFVLASRDQARREAIRERVERDIEAGRLAVTPEPGAFGTLLELRRSRRALPSQAPPRCPVCKQRGCEFPIPAWFRPAGSSSSADA